VNQLDSFAKSCSIHVNYHLTNRTAACGDNNWLPAGHYLVEWVDTHFDDPSSNLSYNATNNNVFYCWYSISNTNTDNLVDSYCD
jgi:hypothetical protein